MRMRALFLMCVAALAGCDSPPAQPTCTFSTSITSVTVGAAGGTCRFDVGAPATCAWVAASNASWVRITGPPGGAGAGSGGVTCSVDANPDAGVRSATITVGGRTVTVSQTGTASCDYTVTPLDFRECIRGGFERTVAVNAAAGCGWTAASTASWLTLSSGSSGAGSGTVTFTLGDNYDAARLGVIEVRWPTPTTGQNVRVYQEGCLYTTSRDSFDVPASGGDFAVDVYASPTDPACGGPLQDVCLWSAVASAPWVTVLTTMPRRGDDRVFFRVTANGTGSARTATISVRDRTVTIKQAG